METSACSGAWPTRRWINVQSLRLIAATAGTPARGRPGLGPTQAPADALLLSALGDTQLDELLADPGELIGVEAVAADREMRLPRSSWNLAVAVL